MCSRFKDHIEFDFSTNLQISVKLEEVADEGETTEVTHFMNYFIMIES